MKPDRRPKPPDANDRHRAKALTMDGDEVVPPPFLDDVPPPGDDYAPSHVIQLDAARREHDRARREEEEAQREASENQKRTLRHNARQRAEIHEGDPSDPLLLEINEAMVTLDSGARHAIGSVKDLLKSPRFIASAAAFGDQERLRMWIRGLSYPGLKRDPEIALDAIDKARASARAAAEAKARAERAAASEWPPERQGPHPLVDEMLKRSRTGEVLSVFVNAKKILDHDPRWVGRIRMNRMGGIEVDGDHQDESFVAKVAEWLSDNYDAQFKLPDVMYAIHVLALAHAYSPVEEYLTSLTWDGVPRFRQLLVDVLGCKHSDLHEAYVRRMMISAVARGLSPGCKVDTMLILQGAQGAMKSTFFEVLCGKGWFGASAIKIQDKDGPIQLRSTWIYEAAEMSSLRKQTAEAVKHFLSLPKDLYREPYGKVATHHERHSIMVASVNPDEFLDDPTGSRRFWPLHVPGQIDLGLLRALRDQLWAEAVVLYRRAAAAIAAGEEPGPECRWWFSGAEDVARAKDSAQFEERDAWDEYVESWARCQASPFTSAACLEKAINVPRDRVTKPITERVNAILRRLGYRQTRSGSGPRVWTRAYEETGYAPD